MEHYKVPVFATNWCKNDNGLLKKIIFVSVYFGIIRWNMYKKGLNNFILMEDNSISFLIQIEGEVIPGKYRWTMELIK